MRRVAAALLGVALALPGAPARGSNVGEPVGCVTVAFSPAVASDHLGFCVGYRPDPTNQAPDLGIVVWVTRDSGHTWLPVPAAGLASDPFTTISGLSVSPSFATDPTFYVAVNGGLATPTALYASTDLGASFTAVDTDTYVEDLIAFPDLAPAPGVPALPTVVTVSRDDGAVRVVTGPVARDAKGSPDLDVQVLPLAEGGLMVAEATDANENDGTRQHTVLYSCDATFTCDTVLYAWPRGELPYRAWLAPDYAKSHEIVVLTRSVDHYRSLHAWVSKDGGRHFATYAGLAKVLAGATARLGETLQAGYAERPGHTGTRYVRIEGVPDRDTDPADEIYRSDDAGKTWKRVGYHTCRYYHPCTGNLPWDGPEGYRVTRLADVTVLPDGRVVAPAWEFVDDLASANAYVGPFCSVDGGKHWAHVCPS